MHLRNTLGLSSGTQAVQKNTAHNSGDTCCASDMCICCTCSWMCPVYFWKTASSVTNVDLHGLLTVCPVCACVCTWVGLRRRSCDTRPSDRLCLEETESSMGGTENKSRMTKRPRKFQQTAVIAECVSMCVCLCVHVSVISGAQRACVGQSRLECLEKLYGVTKAAVSLAAYLSAALAATLYWFLAQSGNQTVKVGQEEVSLSII